MSLTEMPAPLRAPAQAPIAEAVAAPVACGCGCGFPITEGMRVYLINGVPFTLGCVGDPVPVTAHGPDPSPRPAQRYTRT